jgi:molybdopterin molybdotransferase
LATALGASSDRRERVSLSAALGLVLSADVLSLVDLPPFDTSAMDGWAVHGPGPWTVVGEARAGDHPGSSPESLKVGEALRISTGAVAPPGTAVLRSERGDEVDGVVHADPPSPELRVGTDIRVRGEEVHAGEPPDMTTWRPCHARGSR